jgi:hypothetical protein
MSTQDSYVTPALIASGASFAQLQSGGLTEIITLLIAANVAQSNPTTAVTATATGGGATGGLLTAGAYRGAYTFCDGAGETLMGGEIASPITIAATNIPRFTFPALPTGAASINFYLSPVGGAAGTEVLYATGITGTTFDASFAAGLDPVAPPKTNTTGAAGKANYINAGRGGPTFISQLWQRLSKLVSSFLHGDPVDLNEQRKLIGHLDYTFAIWKQATKEIQTLIAANPGSLHNTPTNVQNKVVRTFP